jgi:hypothetical protein
MPQLASHPLRGAIALVVSNQGCRSAQPLANLLPALPGCTPVGVIGI